MKKQHLIPFLSVALLLASCQSSREEDHEQAAAPDSLEEHLVVTTVEVEENPSDVHFERALGYFNDHQNELASEEIQKGIHAYRQETEHSQDKVKQLAEENIRSLEALAQRVKEGKAENAAELEHAFETSERIVAHTLVYTVEDMTVVPDSLSRSERYFSNALQHFKAVVRRQKAQAKESGEEIAAKGDEIAEKLKQKEKVAEADIRAFYEKARKWLDERF